ILSWNPASERMFGYSEEEALGKRISIIIPPDRIEEEDYIINEVKQGRKVDHFETIRKARDGRRVPISLSVSPIIDANGRIYWSGQPRAMTPLTSVAGYLEILSRMAADEKSQLFLHKTRQQVKKLNALVDDLLDVTK